jgi:hypothetical protein
MDGLFGHFGTSMMHDLFGHFGINPDAGCLGMSPCLSHFVPSFSSYLVTSLVSYTGDVIMSTSMDCFH